MLLTCRLHKHQPSTVADTCGGLASTTTRRPGDGYRARAGHGYQSSHRSTVRRQLLAPPVDDRHSPSRRFVTVDGPLRLLGSRHLRRGRRVHLPDVVVCVSGRCRCSGIVAGRGGVSVTYRHGRRVSI